MGWGADAPAAPDPVATANAQTTSNIATANANANINRIDQYNPYGSLTYTQAGNNPDGTAHYRQDINLNPMGQQLLDLQQKQDVGLGTLNNQMLGQVQGAYGQPIDTSGIPSLVSSAGGAAGAGMRRAGYDSPIQNNLDTSGVPKLIGGQDLVNMQGQVKQGLYDQQAQFLDPQWKQSDSTLATNLADQGITQGSEAYDKAMKLQSLNKSSAYNQAQNSAITGANAQTKNLFDMGLSANQTGFGQAMDTGAFHNSAQNQGFGQSMGNAQLAAGIDQFNASQGNQMAQFNANLNNQSNAQGMSNLFALRNQPMNEFNAIRSGSQVNNPQFAGVPGSSVAGTDTMGPMYKNYQGNLASYNNQQSGLYGLGSSAIGLAGMMMLSDSRLKKDIEKIGITPGGANIYAYKYIGDEMPKIGVMADEIEVKQPKAFARHISGFKMVDYSKVA